MHFIRVINRISTRAVYMLTKWALKKRSFRHDQNIDRELKRKKKIFFCAFQRITVFESKSILGYNGLLTPKTLTIVLKEDNTAYLRVIFAAEIVVLYFASVLTAVLDRYFENKMQWFLTACVSLNLWLACFKIPLIWARDTCFCKIWLQILVIEESFNFAEKQMTKFCFS